MIEIIDQVEKKEIISNDFGTLWFYPNDKIVHHQFHKYTSNEDFKLILTKGSEIFEKNGCKKWLSDDRNLSVVNHEDADWARDHWYVRNKKAGWKYWAIVKPKNVIGKMSLKRHTKKVADPDMVMKIFDNSEEAFIWLNSEE